MYKASETEASDLSDAKTSKDKEDIVHEIKMPRLQSVLISWHHYLMMD